MTFFPFLRIACHVRAIEAEQRLHRYSPEIEQSQPFVAEMRIGRMLTHRQMHAGSVEELLQEGYCGNRLRKKSVT